MTIDINSNHTQLIYIDLNKFIASGVLVRKETVLNIDGDMVNSNSFLIDGRLLQIVTTSSALDLSIKDMNNKIINKYNVTKDQEINFKNAAFFQEGGEFGGKRTLERTSQFLRKITNLNLGIASIAINGNNVVTIGSVSATKNDAMIIGGMFGVAGVLLVAALPNSTLESFNSYANKKVIYTTGLFDSNYSHLSGDVQELAFDKMRTFLDSDNTLRYKTLFKSNNFYYLGYYNPSYQKYYFVKYQD